MTDPGTERPWKGALRKITPPLKPHYSIYGTRYDCIGFIDAAGEEFTPEEIAAALVAAVGEGERMREALERIESGLPPGSTLTTDGSWREAYRELQRIARLALKEMPYRAALTREKTDG